MFGSKPRATAAYVAPIPQFLIATSPAPLGDSHPVVEEIAEVAKDALNTLVRSALAGAGRHFTARAEKTADETERREYLDALHSLRLAVSPVLRAFAVELDRALGRPAELSPTDAVPRLHPLCESLWHGLRDQLESLSGKFGLTPVAPRFSPQRLLLALRNCLARTDLAPRTAALTQELLEAGVMSHLDQVYRRIAERLEQYSLPGGGPQFAVAANQPAPTTAPATTLHVDPLTKALLLDVSRSRAAEPHVGYTNAHLAAELLENLKAERGHEAVAVRTRAVVQRLGLVGRLFGAIAADPHLPDSFKQSFEQLRVPMIKSALVDPAFLSDRSHALRELAADVARKALVAGAAVEPLIRNAAADYDLSASFVRPVLAGMRPLTPAVIEKFLADLQDDSAERVRLAEDGLRNRGQAQTLRERLMDLEVETLRLAPDPEPPAAPAPVEAATPEPEAQEPPAAAELLEALLRGTRWYRVFDHGQQKMRWLRLEAFYPQHDSLAFTEFDGANPLRMQAATFVEDLCSGRSAPCNPDAQARKLIQQLQREQQAA